MKDMKKDESIEEKVCSYFEGTEEPHVDLSAAKRALFEEQAKKKRARRRLWIALSSACACILLVAIVAIGVLPSFSSVPDQNGGTASGEDHAGESSEGSAPPSSPEREVFELAAATSRAAGVNELQKEYSGLGKLTALGLSSDVGATYTLYYVGEDAALLQTELVYLQEGRRVSATVYTDLSGGKYRAAELSEYEELPSKTATYTFKETYLNGEYVCFGSFYSQNTAYCVSVQSSNEDAFSALMDYLI